MQPTEILKLKYQQLLFIVNQIERERTPEIRHMLIHRHELLRKELGAVTIKDLLFMGEMQDCENYDPDYEKVSLISDEILTSMQADELNEFVL